MHQRIVTGLAVSTFTQVLLGAIAMTAFPGLAGGLHPWPAALQAGLIAWLASLAGAFAARRPFMRAALLLWAVGWASSTVIALWLAGGRFDSNALATANVRVVMVSGMATVLGVLAGQWLTGLMRRRMAAER